MTRAQQKIIIMHAKRIKKLEADLDLANARIRALEARQPIVVVSPAPFIQPGRINREPEPVNPWPGYTTPYIGDPPFQKGRITCSVGITTKPNDYKVSQ